jgi:Domain of unknown function (DUF4129)
MLATTSRQRLLLLLSATALAVIALAVTVSNVRLSPARPLDAKAEGVAKTGEVNNLPAAIPIVLAGVFLALIFAVAWLGRGGKPGPTTKRRPYLIIVALWLVYLLSRGCASRRPAVLTTLPPPIVRGEPSEPTDFGPAPKPNFGSTISVVLLVVAFALAAFALYAYIRSRKKVQDTTSFSGDLGQTAQEAITALQKGNNIDETIQRCYANMCQVVESERRITRSAAMTPTEFESILTTKGMPSDAVSTLTRLFESSRYGGTVANDDTQKTAIDCLRSIVAACEPQPESGISNEKTPTIHEAGHTP